jgi:hypothetical protein
MDSCYSADLGANAVSVHWKIATDTAMTTIVNSGTLSRTKTESIL